MTHKLHVIQSQHDPGLDFPFDGVVQPPTRLPKAHNSSRPRMAALVPALLALFAATAQAQLPLVRSGAGIDAAAIQTVVDQYRADLGTRREISWDGVPDNLAAPNFLPGDFFSS